MDIYIHSSACISPQTTFKENYFFEDCETIPTKNALNVVDPDYKEFIPANMIRRASHVLKMGISAGLMCLKKNSNTLPDAILVGTAMGCFEDTDKFLRAMDENQERTLAPTSFIQSTHNTVAGQIALLTKCHAYNFTYVHQNLSFEYALLDAMLLLKEQEANNVLVGGVDELIPPLVELFERAGHLKKTEDLTIELWNSTTKGYIAGEGSTFFCLGTTKHESTFAKITGLKTFQSLKDSADLDTEVSIFLKEININKELVSLVLSGISGDVVSDKTLKLFGTQFNIPLVYFKHYCGEYFTASAFALYFANEVLSKQKIPANAGLKVTADMELKNILIINQYQDKHYSFMCVSAC